MQGFYLGAQMNGSDKRRWFRVAPRGLVSRVGKILLGPKTMPIDCYVVDLSAGGACLELQRTYDLPKSLNFFTATQNAPARSRGCEVLALA